MSVPVRLTDLRAPDRLHEDDWVWITPEERDALVDAVEAAHALVDRSTNDLREIGRRELRLLATLRRFDLGGADGQPTTTKGQP